MKTTWYVLIPANRDDAGLHEFETYMAGVQFLSDWGTKEVAAGRSLPELQLTKVKPQQKTESGSALLWVVIDPALDTRWNKTNGDPTRWQVLLPPRETAQRVYTQPSTRYNSDTYVKAEAAFKRFATQAEAQAFKDAAVAVWNANLADYNKAAADKTEADTRMKDAQTLRQKALVEYLKTV